MAHFSKDSSLIELLSKRHGDVFTMIAARWTGKPIESVDSNERDQTKRLVYGILYGMGANTLAEQLHCSSDEAAEKIRSFKSSFPGVASWLRDAIASCRQKGWVFYFSLFFTPLSLSFYKRIKIMQEIEWESLDFLFFCFSLKYYPISCFLTFHFVHYKAFFLNVCDWRLLGSTSCLSLLFSKQEFSFHLSYNCH